MKNSLEDLKRARETNKRACAKYCSPDDGSFCEAHYQVDCMFSRMIAEIFTLSTLTADFKNLAGIEYVSDEVILNSEIRIVDTDGSTFTYDGICISEGKVKIRIRKDDSK